MSHFNSNLSHHLKLQQQQQQQQQQQHHQQQQQQAYNMSTCGADFYAAAKQQHQPSHLQAYSQASGDFFTLKPQQQQQQQHLQAAFNATTSDFYSTSTPRLHQPQLASSHALNLHSTTNQAPPQAHQTHQAANQQQQQAPNLQAYNMNSSDYSSSTYHIYDQISDLIIIKQQRMERKLQREQKRKVILTAGSGSFLVLIALFLLYQFFFTPSNNNSNAATNNQRNASAIFINTPANKQDRPVAQWAPSGGQPSDWFDSRIHLAAKFGQTTNLAEQADCGPHGSLISAGASLGANNANSGDSLASQAAAQVALASQQVFFCKCDPGFWGERCEFNVAAAGAIYPQQNQLLARCLLSNCSGQGQCNNQGRCQCSPGFTGPHCEFRLPPQLIASVATPQINQSPFQSSNPSVIISKSEHPKLNSQQNSNSNSNNNNNNNNNNKQSIISSQQQQQQQLCAPELQNCSNQGQCVAGRCKCYRGFAGPLCQERDLCSTQSCSSGQGVCQPETGVCQCKFGFRGAECAERDEEALQQLFNCSQHGKFDYQQQKCLCEPGFAGLLCDEERCEPTVDGAQQLDCGPNGLWDCRAQRCLCQDGFAGDQCQVQRCSTQCQRNGQCVDGACLCQPGFYGKHCALNGCPNNCSGRGQCVRQKTTPTQAAEWRCQCQSGATGEDCSLLMERLCDDQLDNDGDGLVDCADSECCADKACANSTLCYKTPDPLDILMRKQPPPPTASFFQRMQFLIEKSSSQIYSNPKDFNDSISQWRYADRASVIRGRVLYLKQGIIGVRVSVAGQINLGFTLTRDGGYFDLMVNGGGAVLLELRREPFAKQQRAVRVPWNEIVLMEAVEMELEGEKARRDEEEAEKALNAEEQPTACSAHNYQLMRPQLSAAPRSFGRSHSRLAVGASAWSNAATTKNSRAVVLRDSALVQQSVALPASADERNQSVWLVYVSSRANEFMSTVQLQLTPAQTTEPKLLEELKLVHLRIVIEGNLFEQVFEPQLNLTFTYAWNRRNVYRQKSFGVSTATVSVGYEYYDCAHLVWSTKQLQLAGHDLAISDIGSQWNLNIHHRYNHRDSILQRGDGKNFNLKLDKPRVVSNLLGDGYPRPAHCAASCDQEPRLLKPQALVSAPDGALYVGDFNMIRRLEWQSSSFAVNSANAASAAAAAVSVSVSVSGSLAPPGGARATHAEQEPRLASKTVLELPASRVPSKYSLALSLADGNKLYMSDADRHQVYLVREQPKQSSEAQASNDSQQGAPMQPAAGEEALVPVAGSGLRCEPLSERANCGDGQAARLARLIEPRAIAFDLERRLYIADGPNIRMVESVERGGKIYTLLGGYGQRSQERSHEFCSERDSVLMHKFQPQAPLDLAISPLDDTLHFLDQNAVYRVTKDKRVQLVAGIPAHCALPAAPLNQRGSRQKARKASFEHAQSIAFNQAGDLFVGEDDGKQQAAHVWLVSGDSVELFAGAAQDSRLTSAGGASSRPNSEAEEVEQEKQRASNSLPLLLLGQVASLQAQHATPRLRASEHKFSSIGALAVDQQGNLLVADKLQLRLLSVEPDLPRLSAQAEYELVAPDNPEELLVFNRHGHHVATRDASPTRKLSASTSANQLNRYTFQYTVNTPFGQLAAVQLGATNRVNIYRDGPHHSVKMIETALGGQCKLEVSRSGQVHNMASIAPNATKTSFAYHSEGGLLRQSRDQASGELFEFSYDEFGRATSILHSSPALPAPLECRVAAPGKAHLASAYLSQQCQALVVAE